MRRFGGDRIQGLMGRFMGDDVPLQHAWLDKSIESAQMRVEGYNFDIRKHVLEFDDVVNKQREVIYAQRRQVLTATDLRDQVLRMVREEVGRVVAAHTPGPDPEEWDLRGLYHELRTFFPLPADFNYRRWSNLSPQEIEAQLVEMAERVYDGLNREIGRDVYRQAVREDASLAALAQSPDPLRRLIYERVVERLGRAPTGDEAAQPLRRLPDEVKECIEAAFVDGCRLFRDRQLVLHAVDSLWVRHLTDLDALREGIGLRAFGQQNPLVAYRKEAHEMYSDLLARIQETVARTAFLVPQIPAIQPRRQPLRAVRPGVPGEARRASPAQGSSEQGLGRNDPCWCGSGKKYKHCHMRQDMEAQQGPVAAVRPPQTPGRKRRRR